MNHAIGEEAAALAGPAGVPGEAGAVVPVQTGWGRSRCRSRRTGRRRSSRSCSPSGPEERPPGPAAVSG